MTGSRVNFKTILAKYQNVNKGNVRLTQSTLFLSKPINPTTTVYNFDVLESQTQTLEGDEIRLNLNDEYTITQIGFYLQARVLFRNEAGFTDSGAKVLLTDTLFGVTASEAVKLQPFYDGAFQIAVNNIIYLDKYDTKKSNYTPITQVNAGGGSGLTYTANFESVDFSKNGLYFCEPMVVLSGAKKNTLQLTLPRAISEATFIVNDNNNGVYYLKVDRVVCKFLGLNAQNGASFQK